MIWLRPSCCCVSIFVTLLREAFRSDELADRLGARIAYKSDGVPYFIFEIVRGLRGTRLFETLLVFATRRTELDTRLAGARKRMTPEAGLWCCWPKKTSGVRTDLTGDVVRRMGLDSGLVDNKVCAVDDVWSGLRFVIRVKDR